MPNKQEVGNSSHKGVHQYIMEMDRRPGIIVGMSDDRENEDQLLHTFHLAVSSLVLSTL